MKIKAFFISSAILAVVFFCSLSSAQAQDGGTVPTKTQTQDSGTVPSTDDSNVLLGDAQTNLDQTQTLADKSGDTQIITLIVQPKTVTVDNSTGGVSRGDGSLFPATIIKSTNDSGGTQLEVKSYQTDLTDGDWVFQWKVDGRLSSDSDSVLNSFTGKSASASIINRWTKTTVATLSFTLSN